MKFTFATALAVLAFALTGQAQTTTFYTAATTTANPVVGTEHFLQQITLANSPANYTLNQFVLGVNYADASQDAGVIVEFYTNLDLDSTSTDVLANATYLSGVNGTLTSPGMNGNYTYTFTLNAPQNLGTLTSIGVNVFLTTADGTNYASGLLNGRFTTSAPTIGSSLGYVWNDANLNGTFTGAEKTTFTGSVANIRLGLIGSITPVPEPGAYALCGLGALALGGLAVRRRQMARA